MFLAIEKAKIDHASNQKLPIKICGVKKTPCKLKLFQNEIMVNDSNTIESQTEVDYEYLALDDVDATAPVMKLADLQNLEDRTQVSAHLYIKKSCFPQVKVTLPYLSDPINQLEVCANDETGSIPLILWGQKIDDVDSDGEKCHFPKVHKSKDAP